MIAKWLTKTKKSIFMLLTIMLPFLAALIPTGSVTAEGVSPTAGENSLANFYTDYGGTNQIGKKYWQADGNENTANFVGGKQDLSTGIFTQNDLGSITSTFTDNYINFLDSNFTEVDNPKYAIQKYAIESTSSQGLYDVYLKVKGNTLTTQSPLDVVFVVDDSSSMDKSMNGSNLSGDSPFSRRNNIKRGINDFLQSLKNQDLDVRVGLETYGGKVGDYLTNESQSMQPVSYYNQTNIDSFLAKIQRRQKESQATFTQYGLQRGKTNLLNSGLEREKIMILLTDGVPTVSFHITGYDNSDSSYYYTYSNRQDWPGVSSHFYDSDRQSSYWITSSSGREEIKSTFPATKDEATNVRSSGINIHTLGIGLVDDSPANGYDLPVSAIEQHLKDISGVEEENPGIYKAANSDAAIAKFLKDELKIVSNKFNTVQNGSISDPIGGQYIFNDTFGIEVTDAEGEDLSEEVSAQESDGQISVSNLNVGKDEEVTVHYQVRINTEDPNFVPENWYPLNGRTTFTANDTDPTVDFGVPSGKAPGTSLSVTKEWKKSNGDVYEPTDILSLNLTIARNNTTSPLANWTAQNPAKIEMKSANDWQATVNALDAGSGELMLTKAESNQLPKFNNQGVDFTYEILDEKLPSEIDGKFEMVATSDPANPKHLIATNTLIRSTDYLFQVEKFDEDNQAKPVPGTKFELHNSADFSDDSLVAELTVANDGKTQTTTLKPGTYYLKETYTPDGYLTDDEIFEFTINDEGKFFEKEDEIIQTSRPNADGFYIAEADAESDDNDGLVFTKFNKKTNDLPETGGNLMNNVIVLGISLIVLGAITFSLREFNRKGGQS